MVPRLAPRSQTVVVLEVAVLSEERSPQKVFSDPETQALHERNLEWLRLMKEDPGWALSRLHVLSELEEQLQTAQNVLAEERRWHEESRDVNRDYAGRLEDALHEAERLKEQLEAVSAQRERIRHDLAWLVSQWRAKGPLDPAEALAAVLYQIEREAPSPASEPKP